MPVTNTTYNVLNFGAKGDGKTNDTAAINKAIDYAYANGGGVVYFPTASYVLMRRISNRQDASILVKPNVSLLGDDATLLMRNNATFIQMTSDCGNWLFNGYFADGDTTTRPSVYSTVTANVNYGDLKLTLDRVTGYAVGDTIGLRLGDNVWDANETKYFDMVEITAIAGNVITIDRPILTNVTVASNQPRNLKVYKILQTNRNTYVKGFTLINDIPNGGVSEAGISFNFCENVEIADIVGYDPGAALIGGNYSRNITITNTAVKSSIQQNGHPAKGRCYGFYNLTNLFLDTVYMESFQATGLFLESYCREVRAKNVYVVNNFPGRTDTIGIFTLGQSSELMLEDVRIDGNDAPLYDTGSTNDNFCNVHNLVINTLPASTFVPADVTGVLKIYDSHGNYDLFDMADRRQAKVRIDLKDGMASELFRGPEGLIAYFSIYASDNLASSDVTSLLVGRDNFYMNGTDFAKQLVAGREPVFYQGLDTSVGRSFQVPLKVQVTTAKTGMAGKFLYVTFDYVPPKRRREPDITPKTWFAASPYTAGSSISHPTNAAYECYVVTGGTTGNAQPTFPATDGANLGDGTVTWQVRKLAVAGNDFLSFNNSWNGYLPAVAALPTATSLYRRRLVVLDSGTGKADGVYVCVKLADDSYAWAKLY